MKRRGWLWLLVVLLGLGGAAVWWRAEQARAAHLRELGDRADLGTAPLALRDRLSAAEAAARVNPPRWEQLGELARLYLANGFEKEAEPVLRLLMRHDPTEGRWPHYLAGVLANAGRLDEAADAWTAAVERAPSFLPAQLKRADAWLKGNHPGQAREGYDAVLRAYPGNGYALLGLARLSMAEGDWTGARRRLEMALAADPGFSAAQSLLASVAEHLGDHAAAKTAEARAATLGRFKDMADPWADELIPYCYDVYRLQVIGAGCAATNRHEAALIPLERALGLEPENVQTLRQLAKSQAQLNHTEEAHRYLARALAIKPAEPALYLDQVNLYRDQNDLAAAERAVDEGLKRAPAIAALSYEKAVLLIARDRLFDAVERLETARRLEPDTMAAYQQLAVVYTRLGRHTEALAVLDSALERSPSSGPVLLMMARFQMQSGFAAAAEACLVRARKAGVPQANIEELAQAFYRKFSRAPKL